jgi:hypothetical protein
MISVRFGACLDTHRPPYQFRYVGAVANSLTGIHNAMVKFLFSVNRTAYKWVASVPTGKIPEDPDMISVEDILHAVGPSLVGHRC